MAKRPAAKTSTLSNLASSMTVKNRVEGLAKASALKDEMGRRKPQPPQPPSRALAKPPPVLRGPGGKGPPSMPVVKTLSRNVPTVKMREGTVERAKALDAELRRKYPRADIQVRAKLSLASDPTRIFEASLPTRNISVGGVFLESTFFLKVGTQLIVELTLPPDDRVVRARAQVVRVESASDEGASGFALRFTEYLDGSEVVLATHFLAPVLREFIQQYADAHGFSPSADYLAHTADVLAAWELRKAESDGDVWDLKGN